MKDLMFYLYMRSLAEKELNIVISRTNNLVVRSLKLSSKKCHKLIKLYYQNINIFNDDIDTVSAYFL